MAETIAVTDSFGTYYYIDSSSSKDVLTTAQMDANALWIYSYCHYYYPGWTLQSICGMLGNFRWEGIMNPSQWQYGGGKSAKLGYGLGQWTPATKLLNWLSERNISRLYPGGQIERVKFEADNPGTQWIATSTYNYTMAEFFTKTNAPSILASAWLYDWERPKNPQDTEQKRKDSADYFYTLLSGEEPVDPGPTPDPPPEPGPEPGAKKQGSKLWMYHNYRYD